MPAPDTTTVSVYHRCGHTSTVVHPTADKTTVHIASRSHRLSWSDPCPACQEAAVPVPAVTPHAELWDCYTGQGGNEGRMTFLEWVERQTANPASTMGDACREYLAGIATAPRLWLGIYLTADQGESSSYHRLSAAQSAALASCCTDTNEAGYTVSVVDGGPYAWGDCHPELQSAAARLATATSVEQIELCATLPVE